MLEDRCIAIMAEEGFEDLELMEPLRAFKEYGARVMVIGSGSSETYKGKVGYVTISPNITADKARAEDFEAILIPGGYAPDHMRLYQPMIELVRKSYEAGKIIAAIGYGPQLMISADIVRGRRLTSWVSIAVDLKNAGAEWTDAPVVQDGKLITSRSLIDLPKFIEAISKALTGQQPLPNFPQ